MDHVDEPGPTPAGTATAPAAQATDSEPAVPVTWEPCGRAVADAWADDPTCARCGWLVDEHGASPDPVAGTARAPVPAGGAAPAPLRRAS